MNGEEMPRASIEGHEDTGAVFHALTELIYSCDDYEQVYQAICDAAVRLINGCDHASIMLKTNGHLATIAASDAVASLADALEREAGEGPCIDAILEEAAQLDADLTTASTWPGLSERLMEQTPIRSMAAFRIMVDGRKVGALNLFGDRPGGLTEQDVDESSVLAAFASVALSAAMSQQQAKTLRGGLESNRLIGKAVGLMMAFHKVDDEEAFAILRRASQEMNVKLSEVARQVVEHHNRRPPGGG